MGSGSGNGNGKREWKYGNGNESPDEKMKSWEWKRKCIPRKHFHGITFTQLGNVFTANRKCETMKMITF